MLKIIIKLFIFLIFTILFIKTMQSSWFKRFFRKCTAKVLIFVEKINRKLKKLEWDFILSIVTAICMVIMAFSAFIQVHINRNMVQISKRMMETSEKHIQLLETERKSPLKLKILHRLIDWEKYFDVENYGNWHDIEKKGKLIVHLRKDIRDSSEKLFLEEEQIRKNEKIKTNEWYRINEEREKRWKKIQTKIVEKIEANQFEKLRKEKTYLHYTFIIRIHNPRDVPVTVEDIGYQISQQSEEPFAIVFWLQPFLIPNVYNVYSDNTISELRTPFLLSPKETKNLIVSFRTHESILNIVMSPFGFKNDEQLNEEINLAFEGFYYMGIMVNGELVADNPTDLEYESTFPNIPEWIY